MMNPRNVNLRGKSKLQKKEAHTVIQFKSSSKTCKTNNILIQDINKGSKMIMKYFGYLFYFFKYLWHHKYYILCHIYITLYLFIQLRRAIEQKWLWTPFISLQIKAKVLTRPARSYIIWPPLSPSPRILPLAYHTRLSSPLLFFQYSRCVPSLGFLYYLFLSTVQFTHSYP